MRIVVFRHSSRQGLVPVAVERAIEHSRPATSQPDEWRGPHEARDCRSPPFRSQGEGVTASLWRAMAESGAPHHSTRPPSFDASSPSPAICVTKPFQPSVSATPNLTKMPYAPNDLAAANKKYVDAFGDKVRPLVFP